MAREVSRPSERRLRCGVAAVMLMGAALFAACSSPADPGGQPAGWNAEVAMPVAVDLNPDPHILEINLDARTANVNLVYGGPTPAWTYDGAIPGPLIELTRGDRLIVHFTNDLPEPTTIHWHGIRVPNAMDGMPGHSQPEVPPGGTFDYDFVVPDAGLFWYHPHPSDTAKELAYGLYGAIRVNPAPGDPEPANGVLGDDLVLVLSDIGVNQDGSLQDPASGGDLGSLFGREGDLILVNGHPHPSLNVRSGRRQRWHVVNAARSRYFNLELAGHRFTVIGTDGGLYASPVVQDSLLLVPGQRVDVLVTPEGAPNDELSLRWVPYDRGFGTSELRTEEDVIRLFFEDRAKDEKPQVPLALPPIGRAIDPIDTTNATQISLDLTQGKDANGHLVLGINGIPYSQVQPLAASVGETQVWTITNTMDYSHPFHLHGFFFQALADDGTPEQPLAWRDTLDIPFHEHRKLAVTFDNRPGLWMFHCHILDHAEAGMMGMVDLSRP